MKTAHAAIHIDRPQQRVFDYMLDPALASRWRYLVTRMEPLDGMPMRAGSRARLYFQSEGVVRTQEITLEQCTAPSQQTWTNNSEGFLLTVAFTIIGDADGSVVTVDVDVRGQRLSTKLLLPLVTRSHGARYSDVLRRLKHAVETD